ncbi:hypothetical protein Q0590_28565 [Rhodocytophaga aerolata]|uniref:Endonuclease/exonuclease/phosphatase domain-containing protein n=1 Tax=Rhodocytophaga aerolata TaxID=455078 RepID=A0ABT8RGJ4_9BACT|nr:hypothetical protein [Rhodocytophaga aerolata]MDO1450268.1 hypothetical protein [Rhodocytophaga aerolata]
METFRISWWNVENLFDIEDSPDRIGWLKNELAKELEGWNEMVLAKKIKQLASIIAQLHAGNGPDLLGICEVENQIVLQKLVNELTTVHGKNYQVVHHDTSDKRGIDVAFLYDPLKFQANQTFFHVIQKRTATRDIYQVNFTTTSGKELIVIGNHWPSRSGGQYESEPYRIMAGETLSYFHERIIEIKGKDVCILFMGDFNDEPFNRAITDYALSIPSKQNMLNARERPLIYNLMCRILGEETGTYYFNNFPNILDQFMVSKGFYLPAGAIYS